MLLTARCTFVPWTFSLKVPTYNDATAVDLGDRPVHAQQWAMRQACIVASSNLSTPQSLQSPTAHVSPVCSLELLADFCSSQALAATDRDSFEHVASLENERCERRPHSLLRTSIIAFVRAVRYDPSRLVLQADVSTHVAAIGGIQQRERMRLAPAALVHRICQRYSRRGSGCYERCLAEEAACFFVWTLGRRQLTFCFQPVLQLDAFSSAAGKVQFLGATCNAFVTRHTLPF
jgi:hypothetical protein